MLPERCREHGGGGGGHRGGSGSGHRGGGGSATGAAVEAATGAAAKATAAAVCCGSVRGATEVAVVNGAWAECSGRSGAGGTAAAAARGAAVKVTAAVYGVRQRSLWLVARQASDMDSIGGEDRGGANGVVIGILWCSLQTMANI